MEKPMTTLRIEHAIHDFETWQTAGQAEAFAEFLRQRVWSSPVSSPGLAGTPQTRILDLVQS
jgi:hypothetical protein